jgi:hypothetical protein
VSAPDNEPHAIVMVLELLTQTLIELVEHELVHP